MRGEQVPLFDVEHSSDVNEVSQPQPYSAEHPRDRFKEVGPTGVSQRELLALVLRSGMVGIGTLKLADTLLEEFNGLSGLARTDIHDLQRIQGVGETKAIEIKAALELGRRMVLATLEPRPQIKTPIDAAQLFMLDMGLLEQEEVRTMLLDTRYRVIGIPPSTKAA